VPLAAELIGLAGVLATVAGVCSALVAATILSRPGRSTGRFADAEV
jgi:hypothetical protein